ncbi:Ger(x)C family spore germination protein [Paenibacillus qinlingensis]|uniref:Ger(x)C family spore germination protein n=1 Tax=Paenibacillus qinlingensis TaxID=1837343 RepID=UPI0015652C56|nr:Ger(x)C family spore germination protein [Paenibacillus qinlingensis]NQX58306.1 Ger(x)C family spore germination protein [Paenibacillus qinlingensis]
MMRKLQVGALLITCAVLLTGCWDIKDVNHRVLPIVMGVSYGKTNKYRIHIQVPLPEKQGLVSKVYYKEADTISKALTDIDTDIEAGIDFMHVQLIVFDRAFAEDGIQEAITFITRTQQVPTKALVAITSEEIGAFLAHTGRVIQTDGSALMNFFNKNAGWSPEINLAYVWKTFGAIHSDTGDVTIPILRSGKSTMLEFQGSAVMAKGEMKGEIKKEQSLLINLYEELFQGSVVQVSDQVSVAIVKCNNRIRTSWRDQHPVLQMNMQLSLHLIENNGALNEQQIEETIAKDMKRRYEELFGQLKTLGSDALNTGQNFRNTLSINQLPNWRQDYYPKLETELTIGCIITNSGDISEN